jgi:hypothetical protein
MNAAAEKDFRLEASGVKVTGGAVKDHKILLMLSGAGTDATGLTYSGHNRSGRG